MVDGSYCSGIVLAVLDGCPLVAALVQQVERHPNVIEWNAKGGKGGVWPPP